MDQLETPKPGYSSQSRLARLIKGEDTEEVLGQKPAVPDFLREELEKFKQECIKGTKKGRINKWEIWPINNKEASTEQLGEIFRLVVAQFPESTDTFIGRSFPKGSFIELRDPQMPESSRTLTEFCYIPLERDATYCFGYSHIPALQIELRRQSSKDTFGGSPSLDIEPLGIYKVKKQAGTSIGDSKTAYESALADNIIISYCMANPDILDSLSYPLRKSLNDPNVIVLHRTTPPHVQSDLQLMLKSASISLTL